MNNIGKMIVAIMQAGVQPVENAAQQLKFQRALDTAVCAQLDVIGEIVGLPRGGLDDDIYRAHLRAQILAHRSQGAANQIVKVARLIVDDDAAYVYLQPEGTATLRLMIRDVAVTDELAAVVYEFAQVAKSAGVRIVVEWMRSAPLGIFRLDSGPGLDVGHLAGGLG